jgi:hypothetical protein
MKTDLTIDTTLVEVNCTFDCGYYSDNWDYTCPDIIITSQADADAWGKCGNLSGNVIIQSTTLKNLTLNGFQNLDGSLIASNCNELIEISAPVLESVIENFTLSNLPHLTTIDFSALSSVSWRVKKIVV